MRYLLNLLYLLTLIVLLPWLIYKAITTGKYRRGLWAKLSGRAFRREEDRPCVWFHGVSVGEIHLLKPVVEGFRRRHPKWDIVISTTTDTGYDEAVKRFAGLPVFFWPLDFTWAVSRALRQVRPNFVVLAEGEIWPNFVACAKRQAIPVAVINARMSPRSARRYAKVRWLVGGLLRKLDMVAVQTQEYAEHFERLGVPTERMRVTGSVKYDGVCADRGNPKTRELARLLSIGADELVLIAGSTQPPEEEIILEIYRRARDERAKPPSELEGRLSGQSAHGDLTQPRSLRLIIVPRQKDRFEEVATILQRSGEPFVRRSEITSSSSRPVIQSSAHPIILVDTIGELSAVWGLAEVAFVGGSLDGKRGGQNMIEPAAYGAAVVFGPHTWNFKDTVARLLESRAALQVQDAEELEREIVRLLLDPDARATLGQAAQTFAFNQQGATERTLDALAPLVSSAALISRHAA